VRRPIQPSIYCKCIANLPLFMFLHPDWCELNWYAFCIKCTACVCFFVDFPQFYLLCCVLCQTRTLFLTFMWHYCIRVLCFGSYSEICIALHSVVTAVT
jgi:hypothetical protein